MKLKFLCSRISCLNLDSLRLISRNFSSSMIRMSKDKSVPISWRDSASLILAAPLENSTSRLGLGFLLTERSKGSTFMAGGLCFPGGTLSDSDDSSTWIDLYKKFGIDLKTTTFLDKNANRPPMYASTDIQAYSREITMRMTTIRELFEECGILLCRRNSNNDSNMYQFEELQDKNAMVEWQNKVKKNPSEFATLCEKLSCVPDLFALHEWSNWLTPTLEGQLRRKRFDTVFYMTVLPKQLPVVIDPHEVASAQWSTPEKLLEDHFHGKHRMMPPQVYEMFRIKDIPTKEDLDICIASRKKLGIERWMPVIVPTKDAQLFLFPGDDLYPASLNLYKATEKGYPDQTMEELMKTAKNIHRIQFRGFDDTDIFVNVSRYGQLYGQNVYTA